MNLSRKWLNEFVTVTADDRTFAEEMTLSGSKVEVTEVQGSDIENVVVGRVVSIKRHENSDHMFVCMVDVGAGEPVQIVTGAQNVTEGALVPVAKDGAKLPGGIEIHSGKNRIVRRIFESLGYKVTKLDRVQFAGLTKKNLRRGDWRFLTEKEVDMLRMGAFE